MKDKKKVYCADGPYKGETFKVKSDMQDFYIRVPNNPKTIAHYTIIPRIGFVNELLAYHTYDIKRKKKK